MMANDPPQQNTLETLVEIPNRSVVWDTPLADWGREEEGRLDLGAGRT